MISYQVSDIKYQISSIRYQVLDIEYQIKCIRYQVSDIKYQISSIRYQVSNTGRFKKKYRLLFCSFLGFQNIFKTASVHFSTAQPLQNPKIAVYLLRE